MSNNNSWSYDYQNRDTSFHAAPSICINNLIHDKFIMKVILMKLNK